MKILSFGLRDEVGLAPQTSAELDHLLKPLATKRAADAKTPTTREAPPSLSSSRLSSSPLPLIQPGSPAWRNPPPSAARLGITNSDWSVYLTTATAVRLGKKDQLHTEWLKTADAVAAKLNQQKPAAEIKSVLAERTPPKGPAAAPVSKPQYVAIKPAVLAKPTVKPAAPVTPPKGFQPVPKDAEVEKYGKVMAAIKAGKMPTQPEIDAAAVVATRLGHKRSLASLDRMTALHATGTDPKDLATYKNVAAALRSGNMPAQSQITIAANTISRLASRPDVLGYVPAGISIGAWQSYFTTLASTQDRIPFESLKNARATATKAGHARIAQAIDKWIAKQTVTTFPPELLVAKRKGEVKIDARHAVVTAAPSKNRPLEPKNVKVPVSDKEYANYAAVQNALGVPDKKIALTRLHLAKKTALAYGHGQTAELIDERLKAASPIAKTTKVDIGPAVIQKKRVHVDVGPAIVAKNDFSKTSPTEVAAYDGVFRRLKAGEAVPPAQLKRAAEIAKKTGQPKSAATLEKHYAAAVGKKKAPVVALKPSDVKSASKKYGVPPSQTVKVLAGAKQQSPIAVAVLALGEKLRRAFKPAQVDQLRTRAAANDPKAQRALTGLAAADAKASAQSRAQVAPQRVAQTLPPPMVASFPVTPTPREISRSASEMAVAPPLVANMALEAKRDPEVRAQVAQAAGLMQAASKGDPEARAQIAQVKEGSEAGIPKYVQAGVALAAAGAATAAAKREERLETRDERRSAPVEAPKAQMAPGEPQKTGNVGLVVMGLGLAGLGMMALSKKTRA